jgi:hypothetical protein
MTVHVHAFSNFKLIVAYDEFSSTVYHGNDIIKADELLSGSGLQQEKH